MTIIKVTNVTDINFVRCGPADSTPLVFLHPIGLDLTWWEHQIAAFAGDHAVIALDLPGHGLSGALDSPTFDAMAQAVVGVLEHCGAKSAHIIGLSVGGLIAQTLAIKRPDLVHSLALISTRASMPEAGRQAFMDIAEMARRDGMPKVAQLLNERMFPDFFRTLRPDVLDRVTKALLLQDKYFHASMWEMISAFNVESQLHTIKCPTLIVIGASDLPANQEAGKNLATKISGAIFREIPHAGHLSPIQTPEPFNVLLRHFLASSASLRGGGF
jgi:3-oxoadipate enol-lactonase